MGIQQKMVVGLMIFNIDMECRIKADESKRLDKANEEIPEVVSIISEKLIEDPHNYFYLMFYWKSFSRCGDDEQNKLMIQLLKNKYNMKRNRDYGKF